MFAAVQLVAYSTGLQMKIQGKDLDKYRLPILIKARMPRAESFTAPRLSRGRNLLVTIARCVERSPQVAVILWARLLLVSAYHHHPLPAAAAGY